MGFVPQPFIVASAVILKASSDSAYAVNVAA